MGWLTESCGAVLGTVLGVSAVLVAGRLFGVAGVVVLTVGVCYLAGRLLSRSGAEQEDARC